MPCSIMTSKGQVTIPKSVRDALGLRPGDRVRFVLESEGRLMLERETIDARALAGVLRGATRGTVSLSEMRSARRRPALEAAG